MKTIPLVTQNSALELVAPNVARDAPLSVAWLAGAEGRNTLALMGVPSNHNAPSTLEREKARIYTFIHTTEQLNWMLSYNGHIVGAIWVDLTASGNLPAPSVHIMIGEPEARGKGLGSAALKAVIAHLKTIHQNTVYSRHLVDNKNALQLLASAGFEPDGNPYTDPDGLTWQNVAIRSS